MTGETYKNRMLYYNFMKNFLQRDISPWEFRTKYLDQRGKDFDADEKKGYTYEKYKEKLKNLTENEKKFKEEYFDLLNDEGVSVLKEYEKGAKSLEIEGEMFFMGIWNFLDCPIIEYYPSYNEGFDPQIDVDEETLTKKIQAAFDVLEQNKDRWMNEKQKLDQEKLSEGNGQRL